jgi:hypothetical protein
MPAPDAGVFKRRGAIIVSLRAIVPGDGAISEAAELRPYESDGLTAYRQPPIGRELNSGRVADITTEHQQGAACKIPGIGTMKRWSK